jgi:hypothetical protein
VQSLESQARKEMQDQITNATQKVGEAILGKKHH